MRLLRSVALSACPCERILQSSSSAFFSSLRNEAILRRVSASDTAPPCAAESAPLWAEPSVFKPPFFRAGAAPVFAARPRSSVPPRIAAAPLVSAAARPLSAAKSAGY